MTEGDSIMREILFRGKTVSGKKWIEGYFFHSIEEEHPRIMTVIHDGGNCFDDPPSDHEEALEVIPETVGQYIGLEDSEGNKIFESDIVNFPDPSGDVNLLVYWDKLNGWKGRNHKKDSLWLFTSHVERMTVIGNIHDNPELLKGIKNE